MAEITGEFPRCTETVDKNAPRKGKTKKLKRRLRKMKRRVKFQKKIAKEHDKRLKAETELKYTKLLLQNHGSLPESFYVLQKRG